MEALFGMPRSNNLMFCEFFIWLGIVYAVSVVMAYGLHRFVEAPCSVYTRQIVSAIFKNDGISGDKKFI